MKTIAVILNGTRLPYYVIHHAISKAKAHAAEIFVLFLKGKHEALKGYLFPSDIETTDNNFFADQSESGDETIIADNMQLVKQIVEVENIVYHSAVKTNASVNEVATILDTADLIVVDERFDEDTLLGNDKISLKALKHAIDKPIDVVADSL